MKEHGKSLLIDLYVSFTADDIALVMTHERGVGVEQKTFLATGEVLAPYAIGPAMLPMTELEYTGITEKLAVLDDRFTLRGH